MEQSDAKIRLLIVEPFLTVGGEEKIVFNLLRHLDTKEFSPEIICSPEGAMLPELQRLGFPLHYVKIKSKRDWPAFFQILNIIRKGSFHIIHGHSSFAGLFTRIANLFTGRKSIIWTEHLLPHQHHKLTANSRFWGRLYTIPFFLLELITDKIVYVSETMQKERMAYKPFDNKKMIVISNGISFDFSDYKEQRKAFRRKIGASETTCVIGIVTVLKQQKGVDIFLQSMKILTEQDCNFLGVVIGKGPDEAEIRHLHGELGLEGRVIFTGEEKDVGQALAGMDIVVLPSRFEGMSVTLLEYLAAGLPIIASDIASNREVLGEEDCGLIFPSEDYQALAASIESLLTSPQRCETLSKNARQRFEKRYSAVRMARDYQSLYQSVLRKRQVIPS